MGLKQIAKIAGVSPATVSRVLSGKNKRENEKTRRIKEIAARLKYRKNLIAAGMKAGRSYTVGVIISEIESSFYAGIIDGIEKVCSENKYGLILHISHENSKIEAMALHNFVELKVEGIIISPIHDNVNEGYFHELKEKNIPFVVIDRKYPYVRSDFVGTDDEHGGYIATRHLIELGHKKIGVITGPLNTFTGKERLKGYKKALKEAGIEFNEKYIIEGSYVDMLKTGEERAKELFKRGINITALFCGTDTLAVGAIKYLRKRGMKIPDDISVIGYGDLYEATIVEPSLTTVKQPKYELGRKAGILLFKRISNKNKKKESILLKTELIIRNSTQKIVFS